MKKRLKRRSHRAAVATPGQMEYRTFGTRAETVDEKERSVEAVISTESPVPMFDWERWEYVPEVLLSSGAEYPRQVPLLDSHARGSVENQLGSIRTIRREGGQIIGRLHFSSTSEDAWTKAREGHITDVSAGYTVLESVHVAAGEKQTIRGVEYEGPVNVRTRWKLREGSVTPIGADEEAKLRGLDKHPNDRGFTMNPELRALMVKLGMDSKADEAEAQRWLADYLAGEKEEPATGKSTAEKPAQPEQRQESLTSDKVAQLIADAVRKNDEEREQRALKFRGEVDTLCDLADMPNLRSECYALGTVEKVRERLQQAKADRQTDLSSFVITPGPAQLDKHRSAVETALLLRCLDNATAGKQATIDKVYPAEQRAKDHSHFRNASLFDMARECLHMDGINTRGLTREQIAIAAMGWPEKAGVPSGSRMGPAYHTTGSFPKITANSFAKSLQAGYMEARSTWRGPMRQGTSVPDFKAINRVRLGALPNLPVWPDNRPPAEASFADFQEPYAVEAYSEKVSYSYRLLINDDMDALSRTPAMLGAASRRTVNAVAWAQITSNPLLGDGVAAFSAATGARKRANLTTGAGVPSVTTLQTLTNAMRQMRGENTPEGNEGPDILNLEPRYLVGPSALETTIRQLVLSAYDPASANMLYNTARGLEVVIEPLLDTASTTAWFLFADPAQIDTVEVTFLQGQEEPVSRTWEDPEYLAQNFAVVQSFGAKIMNHRGIQKHAGA